MGCLENKAEESMGRREAGGTKVCQFELSSLVDK